jgi:hypothetical protein
MREMEVGPAQCHSSVAVAVGHAQAADRVTLEVELDQDGWLVTDNPSVMTGLNRDNLRRRKFQRAAIGILNVDLAAREKSDVSMHAKISARDPLHVSGPAKSRRIDHTLHAPVTGGHYVELHASDLAVLRRFERSCE